MAAATTAKDQLPTVKHLYQNHTLDSLRWNSVALRDDDIVIATSYKAGSTWMQGIVANLIFWGQESSAQFLEISPWIDLRIIPLDLVLGALEQQTHRRFMKTHLPLDGLRFDPRLKYVYVGRDARDVFMSFWNHYHNFTDAALQIFNSVPGRVGPERPRCPDDIHELWYNWITRGWFEWETEGYPWWSNLHNVHSWWDYHHLPNILFVHYADLLADLAGEIRRVADFFEIELPAAPSLQMLRRCTLAEMRVAAAGHGIVNAVLSTLFTRGADSFFYEGRNGRWRGILSQEELALYDQAAERELTSDCRQWLENGRLGSALSKNSCWSLGR